MKKELGTAEVHIEELQKTNTQLMMHAETMTAEANQGKLENRKVAVELRDVRVQQTNTLKEMEALRIQAGERSDEPGESEGVKVKFEKELCSVRAEMETQCQNWEEERSQFHKESQQAKEQRSEEVLDSQTASQEQQMIIEELEKTVRKQKDNCLSMALSRSDNAEIKRLANAVEALGQSNDGITMEDAEDHALVRVLQKIELDLVISTMNKVTTLQSKVTAQRVETSKLRKKLQQLDPGSYSGEADDLEMECRTDELDLLIGRVGVAEIESNTTKAVREFTELVRKDKTEAQQALQMGHAVMKSFAGNQNVEQVQSQQWGALLNRATEESLDMTALSKKNRTAAKKGQTKRLALNLRVEGVVHKLVTGMRKKDYALQQGVNIIAVLRNQLATGSVVPMTGVSMIETADLTGQMEQLQASLEAKDIECVQLMEQMEDIQAAKVRGSQSELETSENPNGVKQARLLMEAKEESARLVTKVEELELKTKKLMVYKAAHGFPESADELRQKVEELQVVLDAEVAKTTRLESSIDTLKGEEQLKAEAHESMVGEIQLQMDKQGTAHRDRVAQFGEELGTAEQLRAEMDLLVIEKQKEIDDSKRLCASHEQLIEQIQKELEESDDQKKVSMIKEAQSQKQLMEEIESHERVEFQMRQYRNQFESEKAGHDDCKEEMDADRRRYADHLGDLQLKVDRLKWEEPQEMAWCAMTTEENSGSSHKIKCAIKKIQIHGHTRICIIQMQTGVARVLEKVRIDSGDSYEVSWADQVKEETRSKGWWICSHVEAAQIMAKTIDQTKNMWEVNTQVSKVWTVQRGDEVSIKLLSDEGELVWQTGSVMYAVKASDEEIELDSGSVAIRHIKDVKVQEESQQKAELRPVVSPSSVVNGNETERSPTRPLSGSFERENQREYEADRGSPSVPSSRSKSKGSRGRRSRSKGDRQRWAEESDRQEERDWQNASDSESDSDDGRKDRRNADKRDNGSACTDVSFSQRKAADKLQETCRKKKLKDRLAKCGNNTTASIALFKQVWMDICSDEILYDNRVPLYALATQLFKMAPEKSMFQSIIQEMIFEPEDQPGMCDFKAAVLKAHEKPNFRKWICENVYQAMTGENWKERCGDRVRANDVELVRRCGDARALGRFLKQHTADLMEKAAFKKKEAYIEAVAETTRKIGWETSVAVTLHIHRVRQVFANFKTEEGRAEKFEELMLEIYGGVAEEHRSLLKHVTSNPDKFDRTYENAQQWLTLEYLGQEVFNEIPLRMRAKGPRRNLGNGRAGIEVAEVEETDRWSEGHSKLDDIVSNDSRYDQILNEFNIAREAKEEYGFDTVFCDQSRERGAVIKALEASGANPRVYFSEEKKPASQGHRGVDKPDPRSEASLAFVVSEARLRETCQECNKGSVEYNEHQKMMNEECMEHPAFAGRRSHKNYQCCSVFHKFRHSPWMVLSFEEKEKSWSDCGMLAESERRENRRGLTRLVAERDMGMPCCRGG